MFRKRRSKVSDKKTVCVGRRRQQIRGRLEGNLTASGRSSSRAGANEEVEDLLRRFCAEAENRLFEWPSKCRCPVVALPPLLSVAKQFPQ